MAEDKMSAEIEKALQEADNAIHACGGNSVPVRRLRAHIEALTSRAEKAEGEVASFKRALEIEKGNTASAHDDYADLKREADRMRGALAPIVAEFARINWGNATDDHAVCVDFIAPPIMEKNRHDGLPYLTKRKIDAAIAALSHQADDAGAV